jgi:chaperonin GroEL
MSIIQTKYGAEARKALLAGAAQLNDAVRVTLGPAGRWVIFRHMGVCFSTKDGVTVAREVNLPDPYESIGADLLKNCAGQAVDESGDGTTTATLLAHTIFEAGCKAIDAGAEPVKLCRGIARAVTAIVGDYDAKAKQYQGGILETLSVKCTPELAYNAARISANGDEAIAQVVSDAVLKVGVDGALTIGDSFSTKHSLEFVEGLEITSGLAHGYFVTEPERNRTTFEDATVLILDRRLNAAAEVVNLVKAAVKFAQSRSKALKFVIIANEFDTEALAQLVHHKINDHLQVAAVQAPLWGAPRKDLLEDIALVVDGQRVEQLQGKNYDTISSKCFGMAKRIVMNQSRMLITMQDPADDEETKAAQIARKKKFDTYIAQIKSIAEDERLRPDERDAAKHRIAALTGGVAVIKVGGKSADDVKSLKFQVEDAIHATRAAVSEGVVPGGGSALVFARDVADDGDVDLRKGLEPNAVTGYNLLLGCLIKPLQQIAANAGIEEDVIQQVQELDDMKGGEQQCGLDASTGEIVENMIGAGIVDPLRVVRSSLNAAAACAMTLLRTECCIAHDPANNPAPQMGR